MMKVSQESNGGYAIHCTESLSACRIQFDEKHQMASVELDKILVGGNCFVL